MSEIKFPTEEIKLPSNGLIYHKDNPLSSGVVEMKYMTAREEDILTNPNFIERGVVLDKLLESMIVSKIDVKDLVVGDKNALFVASRILGYGADYAFTYKGENHNINLSELKNKEFDSKLLKDGEFNSFEYTLPSSKVLITFKILNGHDEHKIEKELEGLEKVSKANSKPLTTRLKHLITSVDGDSDPKTIREFVDNYLLARDSRAFREYAKSIQPDINLTYTLDGGEEVTIPIGITFFWPDFEG